MLHGSTTATSIFITTQHHRNLRNDQQRYCISYINISSDDDVTVPS